MTLKMDPKVLVCWEGIYEDIINKFINPPQLIFDIQNNIKLVNRVSTMQINTKLGQLHEALANKYLSSELINEYDCLRSQNQILTSIKQIIEKKKQTAVELSHFHEFGTIEASSISQVSYPYDDSLLKSKFTEEFEQSIISAAIKEVKTNCSEETYETVRQYIEGNKQKEYEASEKKLQKLREEKDEIASQMVILKMEKTNVEKDLERYKKKCDEIDDQKKKLKTRMDFVIDKQNRLHKLEVSFTFKEKINLEMKKRYERLRDMSSGNIKKIEGMVQQLNRVWNEICQKCEVTTCTGNCWRKQVLGKAKQQLVHERQMLKQQSQHIEKEYEVMNTVAMQFKKIFHDSQPKPQISLKNSV